MAKTSGTPTGAPGADVVRTGRKSAPLLKTSTAKHHEKNLQRKRREEEKEDDYMTLKMMKVPPIKMEPKKEVPS